jgi:hypothetical protein
MMKRILANISVSADILGVSPTLLYRLGTCLFMVNRTKFVSVKVFQHFAKAAFSSIIGELGNYGSITANQHSLLTHGASYIRWAQEELGVPLGWLTEGALEFGNKYNLQFRKQFSYSGSIEEETKQIFIRRLEMSDPKLVIDGIEGQELREGFVKSFYAKNKP